MKIIVRVKPVVQTGRRRRAGFLFLAEPQIVEVTESQYEEILDDNYLIIVKKGNSLVEAKPYSLEKKTEPEIEITKKDIIQKLKDEGKIEGVDFNPNAKKSDLLELLN